ncbi:hypothetical protein LCGC14_0637010 [marine sediment metagenome]|uniref:Response regulatory domain-containing protein n=1 Tax=marine sediment metagenome TaxID=412755 RepID=A0A0F9U8P7_9ZZZZ|nr:response regulator [Methylophaga sp.]HEC59954.1 response regulator [Methylophaga sp.]
MNKPSKPVTLFLIEDDDIDALTIERSFKKNRVSNSIIRATDGIDALEKLRSGNIPKPFIILLDLHMPRMGGHEFLDILRADEEYQNTVVFILTTSKAHEDINGSYQHKVAGYYVKEEAGENFCNIVNVLTSYWKIVHFPDE